MIMTANVDFNDLLVPTDAVVSFPLLLVLTAQEPATMVTAGGPFGSAGEVLADLCRGMLITTNAVWSGVQAQLA